MSRTKKGSKPKRELTLPSRRCPAKQKYELPSTAKPKANRARRRKDAMSILVEIRHSQRELLRAAQASEYDRETNQG